MCAVEHLMPVILFYYHKDMTGGKDTLITDTCQNQCQAFLTINQSDRWKSVDEVIVIGGKKEVLHCYII